MSDVYESYLAAISGHPTDPVLGRRTVARMLSGTRPANLPHHPGVTGGGVTPIGAARERRGRPDDGGGAPGRTGP